MSETPSEPLVGDDEDLDNDPAYTDDGNVPDDEPIDPEDPANDPNSTVTQDDEVDESQDTILPGEEH